MLFEIALDYVARHEFENLILFNNNILETRQHGTERVTRYGGTKAGSGSPSASGTREALTILALPRGGSSSPQCLRLGLVCTSVRPTNSFSPGRTVLDLQKGWKPQGDMFPFSVLQHTTVPVCVLPSSQGTIK